MDVRAHCIALGLSTVRTFPDWPRRHRGDFRILDLLHRIKGIGAGEQIPYFSPRGSAIGGIVVCGVRGPLFGELSFRVVAAFLDIDGDLRCVFDLWYRRL